MVLGGLLLGLCAYNVSTLVPPAAADPRVETAPVATDPWRESRRSREILRQQEGAPPEIAETEDSRPPSIRPAAVDVIDGDTFRYAGETIRIADIDTPETHPPRCPREAELGTRATRRLDQLLGEGGFELRPNPEGRTRDRYGRRLMIVERRGRSLGAILVAEGLARPWTGRRMAWCA